MPVVRKVKAEENKVLKEGEHVMDKPSGQAEVPTGQVKSYPLNVMVSKEAEETLADKEPVIEPEPVLKSQEFERNPKESLEEPVVEQEPQQEETFVEEEKNGLQEDELMEGEEPVMETEPDETFVEDEENVVHEVASMEGEEPVMGLKPEETLETEDRNIVQEEALLDAAEAPVMDLDPILETQEVHQMNPNELVEEPVVELEPEETFVEDEGNVMQEETSMEGEEPEMELEPEETFVENEGNILQEKASMEGEEPGMETEPEETFVEDEGNVLQVEGSMEGEEPVRALKPEEVGVRNFMQEEELMNAAEAPVIELDPILETQEVHQLNANKLVEEPVLELEPEETFVEDEGNALQEEALMDEPEGAEGPAMPEFEVIEPEYQSARDPMLEYEPLQEALLMQNRLHQVKDSAESKKIMADQSYLGRSLMNKNAAEEREFSDAEPSDSDSSNYRWRTCSGVVIDGKCYVFFRGPKKAPDAQFFCQDNFPSGHLASVTSSYIHSHMMGLMDRNGGRTRTWIGGLRYLDTGRFIWLDGARWHYADWLPGEPNNTAGVENCVELLSNGKFNDMPCWDLRAFICSYPF
ncbi:uncharacterized protein [Salminus brasiliensis]|uniref:uncharacterized protein n=1 Tax=Salminus brasiliensis TaxID=930266 RepID=UPI003B8364D1